MPGRHVTDHRMGLLIDLPTRRLSRLPEPVTAQPRITGLVRTHGRRCSSGCHVTGGGPMTWPGCLTLRSCPGWKRHRDCDVSRFWGKFCAATRYLRRCGGRWNAASVICGPCMAPVLRKMGREVILRQIQMRFCCARLRRSCRVSSLMRTVVGAMPTIASVSMPSALCFSRCQPAAPRP